MGHLLHRGRVTVGLFFLGKELAGSFSTVFLGGSITYGSSASDLNTKSYFALSKFGLNDSYSGYAITHYNAGVGGTDSWYALTRLQTDVISRNPALVVIEFAVNDVDTDLRKQAAEALVRRLRTALPDAKLVFLAFPEIADREGNDATNVKAGTLAGWQTICTTYNIPLVNWAAHAKAHVDAGEYTCVQLWADDKHPTDLGHADAAALLLPSIRSPFVTGGAQWTPPLPARIYDNGDLEETPIARAGTDNDGETGTWTTVAGARRSSNAGDTIQWTGTFSTVGLECDGSIGTATWSIDGGEETQVVLDNYNYPQLVMSSKIVRAAHTFRLTVVSGTVSIKRFLAI